jgi:hypothetical protein
MALHIVLQAHFKMDYTDEYDQLIDEYLAKIKKGP